MTVLYLKVCYIYETYKGTALYIGLDKQNI